MADATLVLREVRDEAVATRTFVFEAEGLPEALAGQYLLLKLDAPEDPRRGSRSFTMANGPGEGPVLVTTRMRPSSPFKRALGSLVPGDRIPAKGPLGRFTLPAGNGPLLLLAGGIGVTPFRAMVRHLISGDGARPVTLVTSDRSPDSIPFRSEMDGWAREHPWLRVERTVTGLAQGLGGWGGHVGRIEAGWLRGSVEDPAIAEALVAGAPGFVDAMTALVTSLGVLRERIRAERFVGY